MSSRFVQACAPSLPHRQLRWRPSSLQRIKRWTVDGIQIKKQKFHFHAERK